MSVELDGEVMIQVPARRYVSLLALEQRRDMWTALDSGEVGLKQVPGGWIAYHEDSGIEVHSDVAFLAVSELVTHLRQAEL